ncbi:CCHC-type domain-containing protein [Caerostris darwini]|uniref:CCHC-type domain-containing protein n=1 Tax=Caerostris darwini TaxID=1538125 RepID=A0AAV4USM8_9ARAC|nr:CCHC-type domain-containing protein [Caerostris darwini]
MTASEGGMSKASSCIKIARINKCPLEFEALIDTGSDSVICRNSVAKRLELKIDPASNVMYGFGNIKMCAARALGKAKVDISLDSVKVKGVEMLIVRDDALPYELLIGRSFLDRENISFAGIGNKSHVCYAEDNPFANMECERNSVNFVRAQTTLANDGSPQGFYKNCMRGWNSSVFESKRSLGLLKSWCPNDGDDLLQKSLKRSILINHIFKERVRIN